MAVRYSVGVKATKREQSAAERRRRAPQTRAKRAVDDELRAVERDVSSMRGWCLRPEIALDELIESRATWAW